MMVKKKLLKQITYKDLTIEEFTDLVSKTLQVKLTDQHDLINNIHDRYPMIDKKDISLIVKSFFEVLRTSLLEGEILNFNKTFSNMRLLIYKHNRDNKDYVSIKVKISTPVGVK